MSLVKNIMSFRIRFLLELFLSLFRDSKAENRAHSVSYRVWPNEAELSIIDNARYAYFFMLGRSNWFAKANFLKTCLRNGRLVVVGCQIFKMKRPLKRFMKFEVRTSPITWDDKWLYFEQEIWANDQLMSSAVVSVIILEKKGKIKPKIAVEEAGFPNVVSAPLSEKVKSFIKVQNQL